MVIESARFRYTLGFFADMDLLARDDAERVQWLFSEGFPFRAQLDAADSVHVHIKVADTAVLPEEAIQNAGGRPENRQPGYVKYVFPIGLNVIFSSIPVAEEDRLPQAPRVGAPLLDHIGIDMRRDSPETRLRFDAVATVAESAGWRSVNQGGANRAVYCCHTQVNEKRWVYPPSCLGAWRRPLEFAFGPLVVNATSMGCDLRPMDPALPQATEAAACCAGPACAPQAGGNLAPMAHPSETNEAAAETTCCAGQSGCA